MLGFSTTDIIALACFAGAWIGYILIVEHTGMRLRGLNAVVDRFRYRWFDEMTRREVRIVDTQIMAALQNGTAFFASTSLIALGGTATMLRAGRETLDAISDLPLGIVTTPAQWEAKIIGLGLIFGYAFFKFAWSYRLYNYSAILVGATPPFDSPDADERRRMASRSAAMNIAAGTAFNRGQRAFFFALAYIGWFVGPYALILTTALVLYVVWARQFISDARRSLDAEPDAAADDRSGPGKGEPILPDR